MPKKIIYVKGQDSIFERLYQGVTNGTFREICVNANNWLAERQLNAKIVQAGYNSHQFHRRNPHLIDELMEIGFLIKVGRSKYDTVGFTSFGSRQVIFPLRDEKGSVVNFCSVNMKREHYDFLNENGIYPTYPDEYTKRLFITTTILDAATMLQTKLAKKNESVICIPDGKVLKHHEEAIKQLNYLESIVWLEQKRKTK